MQNRLKQFFSKYAYIYLPIATLLCLAGFIGSYLFPNSVLDTYKVNMDEAEDDTEYVQYFTGAENEIGYLTDTDGRIMKGFQIGISKNGAALDGAQILYRVYVLDEPDKKIDECLTDMIDISDLTQVEEGICDMGSCLDGQYPYLPFQNEACTGTLYITLTFYAGQNQEQILPGVFMNHSDIQGAATYINGQKAVNDEGISANVKCCYIYTHDTYPFLYDSRVMLCIFLAASACVSYPALSKKKKEAAAFDEKL